MAGKLQHISPIAATLSKTRTDKPAAPRPGPALGIGAVERETGLGKDLLRVWERRYGFPAPDRDAQGERLYPAEQVQRLRWIKRLIDTGLRPGAVVALPAEALQQRLRAPGAEAVTEAALARRREDPSAAALDALLEPLHRHALDGLQEALQAELLRRGLGPYVTELLAPLVQRVGELWAEGRLQVYEEHLFTELVQQQLRRAIAMLPAPTPPGRPRVLLTTLPGEEHGLGLLMVHALLALEGCHCVSLGLQTPVGDLAEALRTQRAGVLALSFSAYASAALVEDGVASLVPMLPPGCELWAGGSAGALRKLAGRWPQLQLVRELPALAAQVARWRAAQA